LRKEGANKNTKNNVGRNQKKNIVLRLGTIIVSISARTLKPTGRIAYADITAFTGYAATLSVIYGKSSLFSFLYTKSAYPISFPSGLV